MTRAASAMLTAVVAPIVALSVTVAAEQPHQQKGGIDETGPYDVVVNWFKPLHEGKIQCVSGVAAESPDRIYLTTEVEVPSTLPGGGCTAERAKPNAHSHFILVVDRSGKVIEDWSQWNSLFGFPHAVRINPYDPEKHVWVINRDAHQVHEFTRDGKQLVRTLGEFNVPGTDERHFGLPADIAFLPDGAFFVADGYFNSRIVKFDKNGKYVMAWGTNGSGPGQFKVPHGVAIDGPAPRLCRRSRQPAAADLRRRRPLSRRVAEHPRHRSRARHEGPGGVGADRHHQSHPEIRSPRPTVDVLGNRSAAAFHPRQFSSPHQFSVDTDGNLYIADFKNQVQKFTPKPGADPSRLVGQPY